MNGIKTLPKQIFPNIHVIQEIIEIKSTFSNSYRNVDTPPIIILTHKATIPIILDSLTEFRNDLLLKYKLEILSSLSSSAVSYQLSGVSSAAPEHSHYESHYTDS